LLGFLGLVRLWLCAIFAALVRTPLLVLAVLLRLALLRRLVHRVQDAEIVLGVLEIGLRHHAIAAARRVTAELQVFLEQLLRGATDAHIRTVAVEHMVAVERNATTMVPDRAAATSTSAASAATGTMAATTHAFHVHSVAVNFPVCR